MPSSVPQVKAGLAAFLRATEGLRSSDGVTVRASDPDPREMSRQLVILGQAIAPQTQVGERKREETPTLTGEVLITMIGVGDAKATEARDRVYEVFGLIEGAIAADRSAAGTVPPPGRLVVASHTLGPEVPVDWDGSAARRAQITFQVSWTSDVN